MSPGVRASVPTSGDMGVDPAVIWLPGSAVNWTLAKIVAKSTNLLNSGCEFFQYLLWRSLFNGSYTAVRV